MSDIIELHPKEEELIWICRCGCQSHFVYKDGRICCVSCGEGPSDGVYAEMAEVIGPMGTAPDVWHVAFTTAAETEFSFRRFSQRVLEPEVVVAAMFWEDGTVSFVGEIPTNKPRKAWFRRCMTDLRKILEL